MNQLYTVPWQMWPENIEPTGHVNLSRLFAYEGEHKIYWTPATSRLFSVVEDAPLAVTVVLCWKKLTSEGEGLGSLPLELVYKILNRAIEPVVVIVQAGPACRDSPADKRGDDEWVAKWKKLAEDSENY